MIYKHGALYEQDGFMIHYGKFRIFKAIKHRLSGKKVVRFWTGTDARTLTWTPPFGAWRWINIRLPLHRIKARVTSFLVNEHWSGCKEVTEDLSKFGITASRQIDYPVFYPDPVDKSKPCILLYIQADTVKNMAYKRWVYGNDIAEELMDTYDGAYYFIVGASNLGNERRRDLKPYYAKADALVLTKRAFGKPRMKREAELNGIPVYYDPHNPNVDDIIKFIESIM